MFGELFPSLTEMDRETREKLANLLSDRNEYLEQQQTLNKLRIEMLRDGTPESEQRVKDFNSAVVVPLRAKMTPVILELFQKSVNVEGLKSIMPIIVMGLMQSVNLPLLFATAGVELDAAEEIINTIKDYVKKGM